MQYGEFAKVYDALMSDVDYDAWARYVLGMLPQGASVLECACGTGEITRRIAAAGHDVIAADSSADMLRVAAEKLRALGAVSRRVRFVNMDMRNIELHKPVDGIIACCDGVNYLLSKDDAIRFFTSAHKALKSGGVLLFDVSSRHKLSGMLGQNTFADNGKDVAYMWRNNYDDESKLIAMELSFFVKEGELYRRFDETHIQRAHSVRELSSWLEESGFACEAFEFPTLNAPGAESERIQFAARKL